MSDSLREKVEEFVACGIFETHGEDGELDSERAGERARDLVAVLLDERDRAFARRSVEPPQKETL